MEIEVRMILEQPTLIRQVCVLETRKCVKLGDDRLHVCSVTYLEECDEAYRTRTISLSGWEERTDKDGNENQTEEQGRVNASNTVS